nr:Npt1/Npt2 family nucleotide transporter [Aliikangiella sp. G2MR2-5]
MIFYVWQGIYGILVVSHFWSFCADIMNKKSGQRLFPPIMVGASLGAWSGSYLADMVYSISGVFSVMLTALTCLALATFTSRYACRILPEHSRNHSVEIEDERKNYPVWEGFKLVFQKRYLLYTALFVLLMNWINSTGEFIFASYVKDEAIRLANSDLSLEQDSLISAYYSSYYTWVSVIGFVLQAVVVSRLLVWLGLKGSLYVLPIVMILGYGLLALFPVFVIARMTMIMENSCSYSIANTAKNILYLPLEREEKYVGKTTIDTFFWRLGDLLQYLVIAISINYFAWGSIHFIWLNLLLSVIMFFVAYMLMKNYRLSTAGDVRGSAPIASRGIPKLSIPPGITVRGVIGEDIFVDNDPGDAFRYFLLTPENIPFPRWIRFDPHHLTLDITPPSNSEGELSLILRVTDADELSCEIDLHIKWFEGAILSEGLFEIS